MNIGRFLDIAERRFPLKKALVFENRYYTYSQLKERVLRLTAGLKSLGVRKGDRISTMMWNRPEVIEIYLAAVRLGAIFTPINYRFKELELEYVLSDSDPRVIVTEESFLNLVLESVHRVGSIKHIFSATSKPAVQHEGIYEELLSTQPPKASDTPLAPQDPCQLLYTSGTTGRPKGVLLSHQNVIWNSLNMIHVRRDCSEDIALIVGPLFHSAALNSHYTARLALGATSVIMGRFDPQEFMRLVEQEKITVVSGTPSMFVALMENCKPNQFNTSSVTTLTAGAEKLPNSVKHSLLQYFPGAIGIYDVYGCTECSPCVTTLKAEDSLRKSSCVGQPLPYLEVRLLDKKGAEVPVGQPGEVVVRGPNVMLGYYNQPEETGKVLRDGWMYTGDLAVADPEAFLYIVDRKKDIIITGGENVSSLEVEEVFYSYPGVQKAAVVGVPDPKWGEKVTVALVLRQGHVVTQDDLLRYCKKKIAGYKVPKDIVFMKQLPESGTGKVKKEELRKLLVDKERVRND